MIATLKDIKSTIPEDGIHTTTASGNDIELDISEAEYDKLTETELQDEVELDATVTGGNPYLQPQYPEIEIQGGQYGPCEVVSPIALPKMVKSGDTIRVKVTRSNV